MKKRLKLYGIFICILMTLMMQFQAFAFDEYAKKQGIETIEVLNSTRGRLISSVDVQITDEGKGTVGAYAELLCHEAMDELLIWVYLERQVSTGSWTTVTYKQFDWVAEDYPNQDLDMAIVSYDIPNMKRGEKYRLRCVFGAFSDDLGSETWRAATGALYLE
ncbi:hypothetical protein [Brotaphodocola sp.]|uniref:hypothetical protein n=1 Tax=Brotaphodocola sp. TaxID=3073577 RepID=UPI003D7E3933